MGMLAAAQAIPFALLALPAGVFLDRHRKRPVLLASEVVLGLTLSSIAPWRIGRRVVDPLDVCGLVCHRRLFGAGGGAVQIS